MGSLALIDCHPSDGTWGVARGILMAMAFRAMRPRSSPRPNSMTLRLERDRDGKEVLHVEYARV